MKKYRFFIGLLLLGIVLQAMGQTTQMKEPAPSITFKQLVHNYGNIYKGDNGAFAFKFVNSGNEPLILSRPRSSCGCTVPSWPKEPIMPGDSGKIKVTYNTHIMGAFNKTVTVYSNAPKPIVLRIKGRVIPRPKAVLPLKQEGASPVSKIDKKKNKIE